MPVSCSSTHAVQEKYTALKHDMVKVTLAKKIVQSVLGMVCLRECTLNHARKKERDLRRAGNSTKKLT